MKRAIENASCKADAKVPIPVRAKSMVGEIEDNDYELTTGCSLFGFQDAA